MRRPDPTSLRVFVRVVDSGTIAAAAAAEHMAAAAVSKRISELESSLSVALLQRTNRGVRPTEAGAALHQWARVALQALDRIPAQMAAFCDTVEGPLNLQASPSVIDQFLPRTLRRFQQRFPAVHLDVKSGTSADIVRALHAHQADIGIYAGMADTHDVETFSYRGDRLVLICPEDHPLGRFQDIDFAQALGSGFVGSLAATATGTLLLRAASQAGRTLDVKARVAGFEAQCRMVEEGVGVGVLPEAIALRYARAMRIRVVMLRDHWTLRQFTVAVRSFDALSAAGKRFISELQSENSQP